MTERTSKETASAKKPYESPRLEVYGEIHEIAKAVGHTGAGDGSGVLMLKTR